MLHKVRRIVTANAENGRSCILADEATPHTLETAPNRGLIDLWATQKGGPDLAVADGADRPIVLSPAEGGNTFRFFQLPPASTPELSQEAAAEVFARRGDPSARVSGAKHPSMHRTRSLDYIVLLRGRVRLILDDAETILDPYDVVIQRETNHAWENLSDEPALMLAVLVDSRGAGERNQ